MDNYLHGMKDLFEQLGLPSSPEAIQEFIKTNQNMALDMALWNARFWSDAQAQFLKEAIEQDSNWVEAVDHLDALLRGHK